MKIQEITLTNIGPYLGKNTITFNTNIASKNIVLIGGRNGAGKTTLFEAMKVCLYGYKLYGYRQNSQVYTAKIKKMINDQAKKSSSSKAKVSLAIFIEDGYSSNVFSISREWEIQKNQIKEFYLVKKDGLLLSDDEQADFDNYLLQTIPPALFNFHFFNGEDIASFLFDKESGQSFRKAFMQICGLDTLDLIQEQLQNNIRTLSKADGAIIQEDFFEKKTQQMQAKENLLALTTEFKNIEDEIAQLEDEITLLETEMTKFGAVQTAEWQLIQEQIRVEENSREEMRKYLKDTANNILPFLILKKELAELRQQIKVETSIANNRTMQENLLEEKTKTILKSKLKPYLKSSSMQLGDDFFLTLYEAVKSDYPEDAKEFLKLSEHEQISTLSMIEEYLAFDEKKIIRTEKQIKKSLAKTKQLKEKFSSKEILSSEEYLTRKNVLLNQIDGLRKKMIELTSKKTIANDEFTKVTQAFDKAAAKYKELLKERSVSDISARTLLAFDELRKNLYSQYVSQVEDAFICNFSALLTKDNLLDGIYISEDFEVVPYKYSNVNTHYIRDLIDENGQDYAKEQLGERAVALFNTTTDLSETIKLPVKVEQHFSAGEQQIFVMALYQALAGIRSSEIPFVIDTPLARIDSVHRKNILNNFFLKLPGQVIILSTDEEIDASSVNLIQPQLADLYLIEHQKDGSAAILQNQYFKEVSN